MMPVCAGSLDTNALLRLTLGDIPKQHKAVLSLFHSHQGSYFRVSDIAIIEFVFVLCRAYGFERQQASEAVHALMELTELRIDNLYLNGALALFVALPALSFEDCYMAVIADVSKAGPLWTFDIKLARQVKQAQLI